MKLEVGKFYTVRNPESTGIVKVRVDAIREDIDNRSCSAACTEFHSDGDVEAAEYASNGCYWIDDINAEDLVAEYVEPKPTKVITLYRRKWVRNITGGAYMTEALWYTTKNDFDIAYRDYTVSDEWEITTLEIPEE